MQYYLKVDWSPEIRKQNVWAKTLEVSCGSKRKDGEHPDSKKQQRPFLKERAREEVPKATCWAKNANVMDKYEYVCTCAST